MSSSNTRIDARGNTPPEKPTAEPVEFVAFPDPPAPPVDASQPRVVVPATRDRILSYLREHPSASAASLSKAWGLTAADIRYHLSELLESGLIEVVPRDPSHPAGRGRPTRVYRLAAQQRPNHLAGLCHALLSALNTETCRQPREALYDDVAAALAGDFQPAGNLTRRLNQAIELLNQAHYRARWEATAKGPRVLLRACPYAAILAQHPEMCQIDQAFLERLLQARLRMISRQDPVTGKPPACIFLLS